ncbi:hypothetical protein [Sinosporangium siamense]|uniref:Uncharacterized protein n=1 Tax=Sinosporangium siamense TaxID=1367973 RepID=A0A919V8S0_9ACTN|nr:hypothetical protein [Sinosporangium siamense]GII96420.1 hypothetical protein Ssi02_66510 [Sinosporangium siamense]
MNIEDLLRETFSEMAYEQAPPPPDRFLRPRPARWHAGGLVLAAAAAVAVLSVGSFVVVQQAFPNGRHATGTSEAAPVVRPVAEMWPEAVRVVPKQLPNGQAFTPVLYLDKRSLLVRTGKGTSRDATVLWSYDLASGTAKQLVDFLPPPDTTYTSPVVMGDGYLAWWTISGARTSSVKGIWVVPATGGVASKIATSGRGFPRPAESVVVPSSVLAMRGVDTLAIAEGKVVWSDAGGGGVFTMPFGGEVPQRMPGTETLTLLRWPWAYPSGSSSSDITSVHNLKTGEVRTGPVDASLRCSITWCLGHQAGTRRRDGSGAHEMPGKQTLGPLLPALDRFAFLCVDTYRLVLYDMATRRGGDLGITVGQAMKAKVHFFRGDEVAERMMSLISYEAGGRQVVVDLTAIK